jgi:hypothetical protein
MKRSDRGFLEYGELTDERGVNIYIKESSIANKRRVWLFVNDSKSILKEIK